MTEHRAPYNTAQAELTPNPCKTLYETELYAQGDVPNLPTDFEIPEIPNGQKEKMKIGALWLKVENQKRALARLQAQYDKLRALSDVMPCGHERRYIYSANERAEITTSTCVTCALNAAGLTLATLCDMVLGEDAADRSDDALVRAVGELKRERDGALHCLAHNNDAQVRLAQKNEEFLRENMIEAQRQRDAAILRAKQAEADNRKLNEQLLNRNFAETLDAMIRASNMQKLFRAANAAKRGERQRGAQIEAEIELNRKWINGLRAENTRITNAKAQAEAERDELCAKLIANNVYEKLDSVNYWKERAEQAEADARELARISLDARFAYGELFADDERALIEKYTAPAAETIRGAGQ